MPERGQFRFLLDEHYPGWLAENLAAAGVEAVALTGWWSRRTSVLSARQRLWSRIFRSPGGGLSAAAIMMWCLQ